MDHAAALSTAQPGAHAALTASVGSGAGSSSAGSSGTPAPASVPASVPAAPVPVPAAPVPVPVAPVPAAPAEPAAPGLFIISGTRVSVVPRGGGDGDAAGDYLVVDQPDPRAKADNDLKKVFVLPTAAFREAFASPLDPDDFLSVLLDQRRPVPMDSLRPAPPGGGLLPQVDWKAWLGSRAGTQAACDKIVFAKVGVRGVAAAPSTQPRGCHRSTAPGPTPKTARCCRAHPAALQSHHLNPTLNASRAAAAP